MFKKCIKIGVSGTHCSGKTRLVQGLAADLMSTGLNCDIVSEVARHCPLPIGPTQPIESSIWIVMTGIAREIAASWDHEIVIVDRPVLDVWGYAKVSHPELMKDSINPELELLRDVITAWMPTYDVVIASVLDAHIQIEDDGTRNTAPDFRLEVAGALNETYLEFGVRPALFFHGEQSTKFGPLLERAIRGLERHV